MESTSDDRVESLLREQWAALRSWLDRVDVRSFGDLHSVLPGWTVNELVAHLGYGLELLTGVKPAGPEVRPLRIGDYVAQYRSAAPQIQQSTREVAAAMPDVLDGIDTLAQAAWTALAQLEAPVVMGLRGPLARGDYLVTRLLEVVVHADDLHRSIPCAVGSPVLGEPRAMVGQALADAYAARSGSAPGISNDSRWIRLATGRAVSDDAHLPLL